MGLGTQFSVEYMEKSNSQPGKRGGSKFSEMRQLTTLNSILHSWEGSTFHSFSHKEIHACILLINFPFLALAIYPIHLGFWFL